MQENNIKQQTASSNRNHKSVDIKLGSQLAEGFTCNKANAHRPNSQQNIPMWITLQRTSTAARSTQMLGARCTAAGAARAVPIGSLVPNLSKQVSVLLLPLHSYMVITQRREHRRTADCGYR